MEQEETITGTYENGAVIEDRKKLNPVSEILVILLMFVIAICLTYFLCLAFVTTAIVVVVLAIIYGVCHSVLEIFRLFKRKRRVYHKRKLGNKWKRKKAKQ